MNILIWNKDVLYKYFKFEGGREYFKEGSYRHCKPGRYIKYINIVKLVD